MYSCLAQAAALHDRTVKSRIILLHGKVNNDAPSVSLLVAIELRVVLAAPLPSASSFSSSLPSLSLPLLSFPLL